MSVANFGSIPKDLLKKVSISDVTSKLNDHLKKVKNKIDIAVYKIAITYPIGIGDGTYTEIIADTTEGTHFFASSVSDLIGMWIDQDDVQEPDKAIVVLRVDPTTSSAIHNDNYTLDEAQFLSYKTMSVRHWIDIWIDYEETNIPDGTRFRYFDDTHVFSGPIVSVNRTVNDSGDRITLIGFDAEILLKSSTSIMGYTNDVKEVWDITVAQALIPTVRDGIKHLLEHIKTVESVRGNKFNLTDKNIDFEKMNDELSNSFFLGNFAYRMLNIADMKKEFKGMLRHEGDNGRGKKYPFFIHESVNMAILKRNLPSPINIQGSPNLWDTFQLLLGTASSGSLGLLLRIGKLLSTKENKAVEIISGANKHPGVSLQLYATSEVEAIQYVTEKNDTVWANRNIQTLTLSEDIIDMEMWLDYSSVYNILRLKFVTFLTAQAVKGVIPEVRQREIKFPIETHNLLEDTDLSDELKDFWKQVFMDIIVFGEQIHPVTKVYFNKAGTGKEKLETASKEDKKYFKKLGALELTKLFRRYYYGGVEGTVYTLGNNQIKVSRLLVLEDKRDIIKDLPEVKFGKFPNKFSFKEIKSFILDGDVKAPYSDSIKANLNFEKYLNVTGDPLYIWKLRHYIGANAGWTTKLYFSKTRGRSYRAGTRDIQGIISAATRQAQEVMR